MADHKPQASHQSARSICTISTENPDNKTIRDHLKLQVDLENFYPLETEDQSPRRFFDDVSAFESQVSLFWDSDFEWYVFKPHCSITELWTSKADTNYLLRNVFWRERNIRVISQIAQPPDSNYIANRLSTETGKILMETVAENIEPGDFPLMEHKIEFEKLKEPEDQLAMESVRYYFQEKPLQLQILDTM